MDEKITEFSLPEGKHPNGDEVVVLITDEKGDTSKVINRGDTQTSIQNQGNAVSINDGGSSFKAPTQWNLPSPEIYRMNPSPMKPPKIPKSDSQTKRGVLLRSMNSKPKSRFGEQPVDTSLLEEKDPIFQEYDNDYVANSSHRNLSNMSSPSNIHGAATSYRTMPTTPKTPLMASPGGTKGDAEVEEIYRKVKEKLSQKHRKIKAQVLSEWAFFLFIAGCLVVSLSVHRVRIFRIWDLEIWKWCALVMVIFSGMLFTKWFIHVLVYVIERFFLLKKKVLYFVHGLKKSVRLLIWLCLVLSTWVFLFHNGAKWSKSATIVLSRITYTLVTLVIGSLLWLIKNLLLKILASNFHVNTFFDRIQESIFHQYVVKILSGPPSIELEDEIGRAGSNGQLSIRSITKGKEGRREGLKKKDSIDVARLYEMKRDKVSAWTMKLLIDVASSRLSTISNTLDETLCQCAEDHSDKEISSEMEAVAAAYHIFRNVARPMSNCIEEDDLLRFMNREEAERVFTLFDGSEARQLDRKALTAWLVKVYNGRKALAHALTDTKTAVKQLNKLVTGILIVVIIIIWLLFMKIATTEVLVFLSSQLVVAAFMFGNTCKTIFEAIIFVFVMHPFDVGDRCVIDGVQMIVEEMNILTTVFLRYDNEKIYYPNSILSSRPISNFYRSPDMSDSVEFSIDFKTPMEKMGTLKDKIKKYIEKNSQHWYPNHSVVVKDIENVNKIKMGLYMNHTMNFQDFGEKMKRRSELVIEMKRIFEELGIKYTLLPQQVHLQRS